MRCLIDTHVLLWSVMAPERLSAGARKILRNPRTEILVSHASAWELVLKAERLHLPITITSFLDQAMAGLGAHWMPIELRHFLAVADLPVIHGDPFDRLLIAQSDCEQVPLLSADANVARYPIQVIW